MGDCVYESTCLNGPSGKDRCYGCFDLRLLKLPEDKMKQAVERKRLKKKDEPSHRQLERAVASTFSKPLTAAKYEARQNPGSGNTWFRPGDVLHKLLQIECKEREGAAGSIRFQKEWLDKTFEESIVTGKVPLVTFRFKGTEEIYAVMAIDQIADLVSQLSFLQEQLKQRGGETDGH